MSRMYVLVSVCVLLWCQWGCNAIVTEELGTMRKAVALPVAPTQCQALYRIPVAAKQVSSEVIFPQGANLAEFPASADVGGVSCTLVVVREGGDKRRAFWKIQTQDPGFSGQVRCEIDSALSPVFDVRVQRSETSKLYTYASVTEQARVGKLLEAGKITATWHKGEHADNELYERTRDGSLQRKKGMTLLRDCPAK